MAYIRTEVNRPTIGELFFRKGFTGKSFYLAVTNILPLGCVIFGLLLFTACDSDNWNNGSNDTEIPLTSWTDTVVLDTVSSTISISNNSDKAIRFHLKLNDSFPLSVDEICLRIENMAKEYSLSPKIAAWKFCSLNTVRFIDSYSEHQWIHSPFILINSLGGGLCDDRATALTCLWKKLGYQSRIVHLNGHAVAEVKDGAVWELYDPDYGIYYTDRDGNTVGVGYLEQNANIGLNMIGADSIIQLMIKYGTADYKRLMSKYASSEDNTRDEFDQCANFETASNNAFILPAGSSLEMVAGSEKRPSAIVIKLKPESTGTLQIPLVPYAWVGEGSFSTKAGNFDVSEGQTLKFSNEVLQDSIAIHKVNEVVYVYFLVNPKICKLEERNTVRIINATGEMEVGRAKPPPFVFNAQRGTAIFLDAKQREHLGFLKRLDYFNRTIDKQNLMELYRDFLTLDNHTTRDMQDRMLEGFQHDLNLVIDTMGVDKKTFWKVMDQRKPRSVVYVFLTIRYNTYPYLHHLVNSDPYIPKPK